MQTGFKMSHYPLYRPLSQFCVSSEHHYTEVNWNYPKTKKKGTKTTKNTVRIPDAEHRCTHSSVPWIALTCALCCAVLCCTIQYVGWFLPLPLASFQSIFCCSSPLSSSVLFSGFVSRQQLCSEQINYAMHLCEQNYYIQSLAQSRHSHITLGH